VQIFHQIETYAAEFILSRFDKENVAITKFRLIDDVRHENKNNKNIY